MQAREAGGVDTLHVGIYGEWFDRTTFEIVAAQFDRCRQAAEAGNDQAAILEAPSGDKLQLQASGAKVGIYCRWVAEWNGCRVYFVNRQEACEKTHSVYVQFGSLALMTRGHNQLWADFCCVLSSLGFKVHSHKVSRVDLCTDHAGLGVAEVTALIFAGHEISKAKKGNLHFGSTFGQHETYYRGGDRVLLRVYDKLKEVEDDPAKRAVLVEKRWGCEPSAATRVEFQVSRDVLKDRWEIETIEDLNAKLANLVEWLTGEWYRLAAVPVVDARENNNQSRVGTHSLWERVQQAFAAWVGCDPVEYVVPREKLLPKIDQLAKQARGCLATALALCFRPLNDVAECTAAAMVYIEQHAGELFEKVLERRQALGIAFGPAVEGPGGVPF